jgi:L,D-transpeptidase ErfK/SrfK
VNTLVTVVDQPVKLGWIDGDLYVEAHPTQSQADMLEIEGRFDAVVPDGILGTVEAYAAQTHATQSDRRPVDWAAVLVAVKERRGYPVRVSR